MNLFKPFTATLLSVLMAAPIGMFAASHREAPITSLDHPADITDFYAFVSYDNPDKVTFILNVDPFLEPANGPNYFPFDPDVLYTIKIDNNYDAVEDVTFEFRFNTEIRAGNVFTGFVGAGNGINSPANSPRNLQGGVLSGPLIPPAITALDGAGAAGLSLRQNYTVTMVKGSGDTAVRTELTSGRKLFAVPSNVGPRTMPNYPALMRQGIYNLGQHNEIRVFAGTADDPFFIDLGAAFDSLNFRSGSTLTGVGGVLTPVEDSNDQINTAADTVSGYNVNSIVIEVPRSMITSSPSKPVIGSWGATYRAATTVRKSPDAAQSSGDWKQIQRMANPLINELIIGTGDKDKWSMSAPKDDAQFANAALDPLLARVLNAVFGIQVPDAPRTDLLPLVQYTAAHTGGDTSVPPGPVADLLRLNTAIPPTPASARSRLGLLAGDRGGFPNGRRLNDDVTDIAARVVAGALKGSPYNQYLIGDGVNHNDVPTQEVFPYIAPAQSGRERRHIDPGEPGCRMTQVGPQLGPVLVSLGGSNCPE